MKGRYLCSFYLLIGALVAQADDCEQLDRGSDAYKSALQAMSGHFPVPLGDIHYCGVAGFSKMFKASVDRYETYKGWNRHGELTCWQLSQHQPGDPYNCGPRIVNTHDKTSTQVTVKHPVPIELIDEVATAMEPELSDDDMEWIEYVPVECGGSWSLGEHGFVVKLKVTKPQTRRQFSARKVCSPTPCVWVINELTPETWVN